MPTLERDRETELARAWMAGDAEAFLQFVEYFRAKVFHYTLMMCGQREDAEEVTQDTLLRIFESGSQLREPERVRAWVFRIAKNACLMKRRKSQFAPARELSLEELMPTRHSDNGAVRIEIADWSALPDDQALEAEMKALIEKTIRELPETYRAVVLLRDIEELSTQEVAHVLDIREDAVKTRLHRARLAIRKKLDEYLKRGKDHGTSSAQ